MKLKAAFRYQAIELVQSAVAFCLIIGALIVVFSLFVIAQSAPGMVAPNMGALPYVLMVMLALATFSGDVRFLLQMGLSRAQILASAAASFAAACLFLALVEAACAIVVPNWPREQSLFLIAYGSECGPVLDFLFMLLGCAAASAAGLALAALQMRFGTRRFMVGVVAVGVLLLAALQDVGMGRVLGSGLSWAFGFGEGASLANPFFTFAAVTALGVLVAWAVTRRIEVR